MRETVKQIAAPVLSLIFIMMGISFFNTFTSIRIINDGGNVYLTGLVYSAFYLGMMLGALYLETFIHRIGHIRSFCVFAAICSTAVILQSFFTDPYIWILFRFATGLMCAGLFVVIESWMLLLSSPNTRGQILSFYMVALYSAKTVGQFILNSIDLNSTLPFSITVFFASISIIPVCLMRASSPNVTENKIINIFYILKKAPLGFLGNFVSGLVLSSFYALGPVYGEQSGFSIFKVSLIMGCTIFGGMALQWPLGLLSDMIKRKTVLLLTSLVLSIISFLIFWEPSLDFWVLLVLLIFYGGFSFTIYPLSITHTCEFFPASGITALTSACQVIYGIGCILGPLATSLVISFTKPAGLFLYTAILGILLTIFGMLVRSKKEVPEGSFTPVLPIFPEAAQMEASQETPPPPASS